MAKNNFVIYSENEEYAYIWAGFIESQNNIPFETTVFTNEIELQNFNNLETIEIMLFSIENEEQMEKYPATLKFVLYENETDILNNTYNKYINKFQSATAILSEITEECIKEKKNYSINNNKEKKYKIIGVYSPVNRCFKTMFSILTCLVYSESVPALYLNFEEYSCLSEIFQIKNPGNLSDLIYYYKQNKNYLGMKLLSVVNKWQKMDYVFPVSYKEDIKELNTMEWRTFIDDLFRVSDYKIIVADLGNTFNNIIDIIEYCDVVFMPVKEDKISNAKIRDFEEYFKDKEYFEEKIKKINLMQFENSFNEADIEHIVNSEFGNYVRKKISDYMETEKWIMKI